MEDPSKDKTCFVIGPIGDPNSDVRKRAYLLFDLVIDPAIKECGYRAVRADMIMHELESMTRDIIKHVEEDPMLVADLTGPNPSVMYELGWRSALKKPSVLLIDHKDDFTFYLRDKNIFRLDLSSNLSIKECKKFIVERIKYLEQKYKIGDECEKDK
jgi:nucleoside 2-deoxyribosyltransferase